MKNMIKNSLTSEARNTRNVKIKAILPLVAVGMMLSPAQLSADWSFMDIAKKVVKKVVLPATAVVHGVASAAEAYSDGHTASVIAAFGVGGAATHIGNSLVETANDVVTIGSVAIDAYNEN